MIKRLLTLLISAVLLLSAVLLCPTEARAATSLQLSEEGIAVLKQMEGFSKYPYADSGQFTVGYGTACPEKDLIRYQTNGISEAEADTLMREHLQSMEAALNRFADKNNLSFDQNEFDALILFTYNVGTGWMGQVGDFRSAVINGTKGNELIYCMSRWSYAYSSILPGLIKRRLAEADLYLNGNYSSTAPEHYSYVYLNANGGSCSSKVQGYDASEPAEIMPAATRTDYRFKGWYTAKTGGRLVTRLDTTTKVMTLYAHWQSGDTISPAAVDYQRFALKDITIYEEPTAQEEAGLVEAEKTVKIVLDYVDAAGELWGKLSTGGWIRLSDTAQSASEAEKNEDKNETVEEENKPAVEEPVSVTVTNDYVNVRKGPSTAYALTGKLYRGETLLISQTKQVGSVLWGQFSGGWVCLTYTDYGKPTQSTPEPEESETVIATGTVTGCTALRLRSGPGTNYTAVGSLKSGTKVEITQRKTVGTMEWGKVSDGWVCMDYIQLDDAKTDAAEAQAGTVYNCTKLNLRREPGLNAAIVGSLKPGEQVTVYEQKTADAMEWGRIDGGWVCMTYVKLTDAEETPDPEENTPPPATEDAETDALTGTVVVSDALRIRSGAGTRYAQVGSLSGGTEVTITEQTSVDGTPWGKIDKGWICLDYVRLDAQQEEFPGTVTTDGLRIRSDPGLTNKILGHYQNGDRVTILETKKVSGMDWGRTDKGWISLQYVKRQ